MFIYNNWSWNCAMPFVCKFRGPQIHQQNTHDRLFPFEREIKLRKPWRYKTFTANFRLFGVCACICVCVLPKQMSKNDHFLCVICNLSFVTFDGWKTERSTHFFFYITCTSVEIINQSTQRTLFLCLFICSSARTRSPYTTCTHIHTHTDTVRLFLFSVSMTKINTC